MVGLPRGKLDCGRFVVAGYLLSVTTSASRSVHMEASIHTSASGIAGASASIVMSEGLYYNIDPLDMFRILDLQGRRRVDTETAEASRLLWTADLELNLNFTRGVAS